MRTLAVLFGSALLAGCGERGRPPGDAQRMLATAAELKVVALAPEATGAEGDLFLGHKVLGEVVVKDAELRGRLLRHLDDDLNPPEKDRAACFNPRHGLRAAVEGHSVEVLLCYECHQAILRVDGVSSGSKSLGHRGKALFESILRDAGIATGKDPPPS